MAGIVATSATTNNSASTATDTSVTGYLTGEEITLTTDPTGSSYSWTLSTPSGSTSAVLTSSAATSAAPKFTPDSTGYYVITVTVDSATVYVLRISAASVGTVADIGVARFAPLTNTQAPTPAAGAELFYSSTEDSFAAKMPDATIRRIPMDSTIKHVYSVGDLPDAVSDTITIASGVRLRPHGIVDLSGSNIALSEGASIVGTSTTSDGFTSSNTSGTVIRAGNAGTREISNCKICNTGTAGPAVSFVAASTDVYLVTSVTLDGGTDGVGLVVSGTADNLNAYRTRFKNCAVGIQLSAVFEDVAIANPIVQAGDNPNGFIGVQIAAAAEFNTFSLALGLFASNHSSDIALDFNTPTALTRGLVVTSRFTGAGAALAAGVGKVTTADSAWEFSGNQGIVSSVTRGVASTDIEAPPGEALTISTVDTWINTNDADLNWELRSGARISQDGTDDDLFRYTGADDRPIKVSAMVSAEKAGSGNAQFGITISHNGSPAVGATTDSDDEGIGELNAGQARQIHTTGHFTVSNNDSFRVLVRNRGGTDNIEVRQVRLVFESLGQ